MFISSDLAKSKVVPVWEAVPVWEVVQFTFKVAAWRG